ncbi:MAG: TrkH family potassium uptake protein [bacterium]|nr:TrkH family potassium uptake protein [bacterium]
MKLASAVGWLGRRGMFTSLLLVTGVTAMAVGLMMLLAAGVSLLYGEMSDARGIGAAAAVTLATGTLLRYSVGQPIALTTRAGFAGVGVAWLMMSAFGTLPYLFSGAIPDVTNAAFETVSGFTTTGASLLADPGQLSHGILFWRSLTQWMGGMGIIVLFVAVLPLLGVGGMELARAESPGGDPDRLTPRFQDTAKRLWLIYAMLTCAEALLLWAGDMDLFQAVNHSLTTLSTGGFSTEATSITGFSAYTQWVIVVFMVLAGVSFSLHFRALLHPRRYFASEEFRVYFLVVAAAGGWLTIALTNQGTVWEQAVREGVFTAVSMVTTTGYSTADFGTWAPSMQLLVLVLMTLGGMGGSTAGGIKSFRLKVVANTVLTELRRVIHPRGMFIIRLDKRPLPTHIIRGSFSFLALYLFLLTAGALAFITIESSFGSSDLVTSLSAVVAGLGNIGPGLGEVGPAANYAMVSPSGKWLLSLLMMVGRLEILPIVVLAMPSVWRK